MKTNSNGGTEPQSISLNHNLNHSLNRSLNLNYSLKFIFSTTKISILK